MFETQRFESPQVLRATLSSNGDGEYASWKPIPNVYKRRTWSVQTA